MQIIFGTLDIEGLSSFLQPQNALLLMAGFPDPQQASRAATNLIHNIRGLQGGTPVAVTGTPSTLGSQPAIVMTDINRAGGLEVHATEAMARPARPSKRKAKRSRKSKSSARAP